VVSFNLRQFHPLNKKIGRLERRRECNGKKRKFVTQFLRLLRSVEMLNGLVKRYWGTAVSLTNFRWFNKIGHFLLNPIGHVYVCSIITLKLPVFKAN